MKKRITKGFTLVEIMIVVAIIGLLVAIALPNFMKARRKAQIKATQASLKQIEGAYEQYLLDGGTTVVSETSIDAATGIKTAIIPNYVKIMPTCPGGGTWSFYDTSNVFTATVGDLNDGAEFTSYDTVNP